MHVLVLPKWYPALPDPQLGDFIRKQMLAVATRHRVSVIYPCAVHDLPEDTRQELDATDGAWELRCYYRPSTAASRPLRKLANLFRYRSALNRGVARLLRERGKPDLVHAHILARPVFMAWRFSLAWQIPFVASEQSSAHLNGGWLRKSWAARRLDRMLLHKAACTTAVSPHLAAAMAGAGLGHDHVVVPNVVPGLERTLPLAGPAERFMVVADLVDATKNVSGVLRALAAARAQGHALELDVVGGGPDQPHLHHLARSLLLHHCVHWHGRVPQPEVLRLMAGTGTVIINSNYETFSVVTGEALASGKPVIATRCGGPEAFITADNGLLIPVADDAALCRAMEHMARHHHRYAPETVRASVGRRYGPQAVADAFDRVYQQALQHR